MPTWLKVVETLMPLILAVIAVPAGRWVKSSLEERQLALQWIDTSLSILRDASDEVMPLRKWAVEMLEHYSSDVAKLDPEARRKLIEGSARMPPVFTMARSEMPARTRHELAYPIRRELLERLRGLDIHDVSPIDFTADGDAAAAVLAHPPGREDTHVGGQIRVTAPFDWSRLDDPALFREVANVLAERIRHHFDADGHYRER